MARANGRTAGVEQRDPEGTAAARLFAGPGALRALCRALDWGATLLGPVESWSPAITAAARLCSDAGFASCLYVGDDLALVYNDAFVAVLGRKHPGALGRPAREVWAEVWAQSAPDFERVRATGAAVLRHDQRFVLDRGADGAPEEAFYTFAFSPVRDEGGAVVGVLSTVVETTARVRAEAALRGSEQRFRLMADATPQIIWITDADGQVEFFNHQWAAYTAATYEPATAAEVAAAFVHPDDRAATMAAFSEARRTAGVFAVEHRVRSASGDYRWFLVRAEPYRDPQTGEVVRWFGASVDIHDRKVAEAERERLLRALETERARLSDVFRRAPAFLAVLREPAHVVHLVNDAYCQLVGPGRDLIGRPLLEALPELRGQGFDVLLDRVRDTGEPFVGREVPVRLARTPGGPSEERYVDLTYLPLVEADGARAGVIAHGTDVTEQVLARREVERLLAESERAHAETDLQRRRLETVLRQLPVGVVFAEAPSGRIVQASAATARIWGAAPHTARADEYSADYVGYRRGAAAPVASHEWPLARALAAGEVVAEEVYEVVRPDGSRRFVALSAAPVRDAGGAVHGAVAISLDVTERERLLAESEAARAEAEAANRAKGEFLAVMSHELRTPLNAIGGYAELMEMGIRGPVTPQQVEDLGRIQRSQRHLLGLVNEVLNYAKLETGTVRYDAADVVVCDALAAAEGLVAPQARARGLTLAVADCPAGLAVRADPEKLRQVLVNLLSNAVKFTDPGGRIAVACAADGASVRIAVGDSGIGIAPDQLERVFEPFVQVRADLTRTAEGTGLGLAISRDLARGMGGDLTVESESGVGSTFTLTLPRA